MSRERIIWVVALLVVAGIGFYSGQTIGVRTGEQNRAQAAQQFFGQRGGVQAGAQSGAGGAGQAGGQGTGGAGRGGMFGTVSDVSGNTITITTRNGQTSKIELAANATVRKQVDGQISDIKTGEQIIATGAPNGDTFQATSVQVGAQLGGFGGGQGGQGGGRGAQNGAGGAQPTPTP